MSKMMKCKACSKEIAVSAKTCPGCGAKNSKKFYKRWWFFVIIGVIIIADASSGESDNPKISATSKPEVNQSAKVENNKSNEEKIEDAKAPEKKIPAEYKSALKKAKTYSDMMHMSKAAIYDQLTSEYAEKFSKEAAKYAMENLAANWKENALKSANTYQESMAMSPQAIYDQLISEYGGKFTKEEAQYAIDNLK